MQRTPTRLVSRADVYTEPPTYTDGFTRVSQTDCATARAIFRDQSLVQTAYNVTLSALLGGGLLVEHPVLPLSRDEDRSWFGDAWGRFVSDLLADFWTYGFAVCRVDPDARYVAVPRVVPQELVDVEVRMDLSGRRAYRVTAQTRAGGAPMGLTPHERILRDVIVFEYEPPDCSGRLHSRVMGLVPDWLFVSNLTAAYATAVARRADVPLVLEQLTDSYDQKNIRPAESQPPLGLMQPAPTTLNEYEYLQQKRVIDNARLMNAGLAPENPLDVKTVQSTSGATVVHLPRDRKLVHQLVPEAPREVTDTRLDFVMRVGAVFQVPIAALFGLHRGRRTESSSLERDVAMELFMQQQRDLKRTFLPILKDVFVEAYLGRMVALAAATVELHDVPLEGDLEKASEVAQQNVEALEGAVDATLRELSITLPGIPPVDATLKLYAMGLLKYDALRAYMATVYSIPDGHLEPTQKLDLEDSGSVALGVPVKKETAPATKPGGGTKRKASS